MKKHVTDTDPSLFDDIAPIPEPPVMPVSPVVPSDLAPALPAASVDADSKTPVWEFAVTPHVDFMVDEPIVAFCYSLADLELRSSYYALPVLKQMMKALAALASSSTKSLRRQAFTVYGGDVIETDVFVIGFAAKSAALVDFLASYMRRAPAYDSFEACSSAPFMPLFRYDHGHIIQYLEEGAEGTSYVDTEEYYGTGLVMHVRLSRPADMISRSRSVYGKLLKAE